MTYQDHCSAPFVLFALFALVAPLVLFVLLVPAVQGSVFADALQIRTGNEYEPIYYTTMKKMAKQRAMLLCDDNSMMVYKKTDHSAETDNTTEGECDSVRDMENRATRSEQKL